jgi:hypothetical protein
MLYEAGCIGSLALNKAAYVGLPSAAKLMAAIKFGRAPIA